MTLTYVQYLLGAASGGLVGLSLGLFGGGGSILAVPLMVYLVKVPGAHMAIGTSALAVAANAAMGLATHARHGSVRWACALVFAAAGILGAFAGSSVGKMVDGGQLVFLFAILMFAIGILMLRHRRSEGDPAVRCSRQNAPKVGLFGLLSGAFSGFFGIGGGFLIVPALIAATGMATLNAIASSLVAVTAFGATTALNYAYSGLVDWPLAAVFIAGGLLGSLAGERLARHLSTRGHVLRTAFAGLVILVSLYMGVESASRLGLI